MVTSQLAFCGDATNQHVVKAIACFRETLTKPTKVVVVTSPKVVLLTHGSSGFYSCFEKNLKGRAHN